jgi:hypothetical protein
MIHCWECPRVKVWSLGLVSKHWNTIYYNFYYMFARSLFYFRLQLPLIIIHITCILLSLRRTSAPIHLTSVLGVLGTLETSCIVIAGLLETDIFDLFLLEFDEPWVIHLRETCCCSTNLCTWRPNTVYENRSVHRHQEPSRYCYGPIVQGWTTHASLQRRAWWWRLPPVIIPLSDRVPRRASEPSRARVDDGGSYGTFCGWRLGYLGFSQDWVYIGGKAKGVGPRGAHTIWRHDQGGPRRHLVWPSPGCSLALLWSPGALRQNIDFGLRFVQFREYFQNNFSEIQK